jgi:transposase
VLRAALDAILYIARTGCQWRMLSKGFPPFTTVRVYFFDWRDDGSLLRMSILSCCCKRASREASPSAGSSKLRGIQPARLQRRPRCRRSSRHPRGSRLITRNNPSTPIGAPVVVSTRLLVEFGGVVDAWMPSLSALKYLV